MKFKRLIFFALFMMFGFGPIQTYAQKIMVIRFHNGLQEQASISALSKILFSDNKLIINYTGGNKEVIDLSTVQVISFDQTPVYNVLHMQGPRLSVYTSPAKDIIKIVNLPAGIFQATIYQIEGNQILQIPINSRFPQVDVSLLPQGFYLLRVNNQTVKFAKQ